MADRPSGVGAGAEAPSPSIDVAAPLTVHRRRLRVRVLASRGLLVLAVLGLLSAVTHRSWSGLGLFYQGVLDLAPSTTTSSLVLLSIIMLLTARGLRRGSRLAWAGTVVVLVLSIVVRTGRGEVLAAVVLVAATWWLATRRLAFPVRPTRHTVRVSIVIASIFLVIVLLLVAGVVWWTTTRSRPVDELEPQLRLVGYTLELAFVVTLLWTLLSPRHVRRPSAAQRHSQREAARAVVARWGTGTLDYFALRDDKTWFLVDDCVVAYSVRGGVALVSPDPIGPPGQRELAWVEFLEHAASFGWSVSVVAAAPGWVPVYEASGLRSLYLGDEAIVDCPGLTLDGREHRSLRQAVNRVARAGYTTTFHDPAALDADLRSAVLAMADQSRRGDDERGFSMTLSRLCDPADTGLLMSITRTPEGRVDAFCQWVPALGIDGWSLDVMRRRLNADDLPNGLMDATVYATTREVARRGERHLGLNFAVLREVVDDESRSWLDQAIRPVLLRLSEATQLATLTSFNEKFDPTWVPRYLILDSAEYVAVQALAVAGAEGVTEIPVIGRFLAAAPDKDR